MNLKNCLIYGNCQAMAIRNLLSKQSNFCEVYNLLELPAVHLLSEEDVPDLEKLVSTLDLFIYQPVSKNYKGIQQLSSDYLVSLLTHECQCISFPVAYFTGYHPEITYLQNKHRQIINQPFPYHDINILNFYASNKSVTDTLKMISSDEFYDCKYVQKNLNTTLEKLETREQELTIKISSFIKNNFSKTKLFYTFNHPSNKILFYIIDLIMNLINIPQDSKFESLSTSPELLARSSFPIYPSVYKHLDLSFPLSKEYKIEQKIYSQKEVIESFFSFYDLNSDKVEEYLHHTVCRT